MRFAHFLYISQNLNTMIPPPPPTTKTDQIVIEVTRHEFELAQALSNGFRIISHVAQHVSTGAGFSIEGKVYFVLERTTIIKS